MGRHKLPIDKEELSKWARAGSHLDEIAQRLGVSQRTLMRRLEHKEYRDLIPKAHAELKISLRTKQVQMALNGDVTMLIWLGKQMLGQRNEPEPNTTVNVNIGITDGVATLRDRVARILEREREGGVLQLPKPERTGSD